MWLEDYHITQQVTRQRMKITSSPLHSVICVTVFKQRDIYLLVRITILAKVLGKLWVRYK